MLPVGLAAVWADLVAASNVCFSSSDRSFKLLVTGSYAITGAVDVLLCRGGDLSPPKRDNSPFDWTLFDVTGSGDLALLRPSLTDLESLPFLATGLAFEARDVELCGDLSRYPGDKRRNIEGLSDDELLRLRFGLRPRRS